MIRPATAADAESLAPRLRETDVREVVALSGGTALTALLHGVRSSAEAWAIEMDGQVEAMFGHRAAALRGAVVWALASPRLPENRLWAIKTMRAYLDEIGPRYGRLGNLVDPRNEPSIKLLRHLGFTVGARALKMPGGGEALPFWRCW